MYIQPKPFLDKIKIRNKAYGIERRRNISKLILEKGTPLPKEVRYKDIDEEFNKWVEEALDISFNGNKIPTFKLFSNQRISEYAQNWQHTDSTGNIIMNFKSVTRENNPKKGENQGSSFNIPGNRDYPMFIVPVLQENGDEAYDMYSMKQPFTVDLYYSITLVTNKYTLLNDMNEKINFLFKSINCYIKPNEHYMPMTLDDISDESEYNTDDRKYYSQTYKIKVKAYIIRKEDFTITKLPSRAIIKLNTDTDNNKMPQISIEEEDYIADDCCLREENEPYYNKLIKLIIQFPKCTKNANFTIDTDLIIRKFETNNVYDFVMSINDEFQNFDNDIYAYNDDKIHFEIERNDLEKDSSIIISGFDPNVILDNRYNPESSLDEKVDEEQIIYENQKDS